MTSDSSHSENGLAESLETRLLESVANALKRTLVRFSRNVLETNFPGNEFAWKRICLETNLLEDEFAWKRVGLGK